MDIISFKNVSSQYRRSKHQQLKNISFNIKKGDLTLLMGPSGSGKSTLVLLMNGIIPHHTRAKVNGSIEVFGKNPLDSTVLEMSSIVGMLLQDPESQLATSRVKDEIILTLEFQGLNYEEIDSRLQQLLDDFEIRYLENQDSTKLSGGEKQLVALAAMMSLDPDIIILDEPTSNLDPVNTTKVLGHIKRLKSLGKTIILIEHKINEVFNVCPPDRILLMKNGTIIAHDTPKNLFRRKDLYSQGLILPYIIELFVNNGIPISDNIPLSLSEFKTYLNSLSFDEISKLKSLLKAPDRINLKQNSTLMTFNDISFQYRNQATSAISNISFTINKGEFIAIVGNNGAGKSTLVKHMIGLIKPCEGDVILDGQNTKKTTAAQLARKVSFLFQNPDTMIFASSVLNEVKYAPINCKMPKEEAIERAKKAIEAVKLEEYIDQNPLKLSMGQKQRVVVAGALAMKPKLIVLDEPTTGQDPWSLQGIMDLMLAEYKTETDIVMVTHDMNLVDRVANRVLVMGNNRLIADDETDKIFSSNEILAKSNLKPPLRVQYLTIVNEKLREK